VFEALEAGSGSFYVDDAARVIYYAPQPGESIATLQVGGCRAEGAYLGHSAPVDGRSVHVRSSCAMRCGARVVQVALTPHAVYCRWVQAMALGST
jgi:hypothetical protein